MSWHSKKQNSVALSTTEAEYIAAGLGCVQVLWMKQTLSDFGLTYSHVPIKCDNTSDSCHSRVIQNQQNLYPKFLLLP